MIKIIQNIKNKFIKYLIYRKSFLTVYLELLPDIYNNGNYNKKRIKRYKKVLEDYYTDESIVRDIFSEGADFYKELLLETFKTIKYEEKN